MLFSPQHQTVPSALGKISGSETLPVVIREVAVQNKMQSMTQPGSRAAAVATQHERNTALLPSKVVLFGKQVHALDSTRPAHKWYHTALQHAFIRFHSITQVDNIHPR